MRHFIFLLGIGSLGCSSTASYQGDDNATSGSAEFSSTSDAGAGSPSGTGGAGGTGGIDVEPSSDTMVTVSAATATSTGGASVTSESSSMETSASASTTDSTGGVTSTTTGAAGADSSSGSVTSAGGSGGSGMTSTETTGGGSGGVGGSGPTTSTESTSTTGDIDPVECKGLTLYRRCNAGQGYPWYPSGEEDPVNSECVREVSATCTGAVAFDIPAGHCLVFRGRHTIPSSECTAFGEEDGVRAFPAAEARRVEVLLDPEWAAKYQWAAYMWADPSGLCSNIGKTGSISSCANYYGPCGLYEDTWPPRDC